MVHSSTLFKDGLAVVSSYDDTPSFFWQCPKCKANTLTEEVGFVSVDDYERKGIVKCPGCGTKDIVHFHYTDVKKMSDAISEKKYTIQMVYYYTGRYRVKAAVEGTKDKDPVVIDVLREPRTFHKEYDEEDHDSVPSMERATRESGFQDHREHHEIGISNKDEE